MPIIVGLAAVARSGKDTVASMLLEHPDVAAYALADPLKAGCQALFGLTDEQAWSDELKEKTVKMWGESPRQMFQRVGTEWLRDHNPDHWLLRADRELNHPIITAAPPLPANLASLSSSIWLAVQAIWGLSCEQTWQPNYRNQPDPFWSLTPNQMYSSLSAYVHRDFPQYEATRANLPIKVPMTKLSDTMGKAIFVIKDIRFENEAAFWRRHNGVIWHIVRRNAMKVNLHSSEYGIKIAIGDKIIDNNGTIEELRTKVNHAWNSVHH